MVYALCLHQQTFRSGLQLLDMDVRMISTFIHEKGLRMLMYLQVQLNQLDTFVLCVSKRHGSSDPKIYDASAIWTSTSHEAVPP